MDLLKSGAAVMAGSMAGNISNYLFQFLMSRNLSIEDYGAMNSVFSMLVIVAIPATAVMLVTAKYISSYRATGDSLRISSLYRNSLVKMSFAGALAFLPFAAFGGHISAYLKINSHVPVMLAGISVLFTFAFTVNLGMLQGLKRFYLLGAGLGLTGAVKLGAGALSLLLGLGLNGAIGAVTFTTFAVFVITAIPLLGHLKKNRAEVRKETREIVLYALPVLFSALAFTAITNIDMIIVRHLFTSEEAGLYAAASVLGKTVLFLPSAFVLALFPAVAESHTLNRDAFAILDKGLLFTALLSMAGVMAFAFFPELAIKTLFGARFIAAAPLLKLYGIAMAFMAVISVLISFNLARNRTGFIYSLVAASIALFGLIHMVHGGLQAVMLVVLGVHTALAAFNLFLVYRERLLFNKA